MTEQWLLELPPGFTLIPFDLGITGIHSFRISSTEAHLGGLSCSEAVSVSRVVVPDPDPTPDPTPTPDPIIPPGYRLKYDRNMRQSADLHSTLVATITQGATVRTLTNEKPVADGLVWRRVEWDNTPVGVHVGWLAVCNVGDVDGVGSWIEALGAG